MFKNFTRGGQTAMHAIRMFGQVSKRLILLALLLYITVASCYVYQKTTKYQWYLLVNYAEAWLELAIQGNQAVHRVKEPTGELVNMVVSEFVHNDFLKQQLNNFSIAINSALLTSLKAAGLFLGALIVLLCYRGKLQTINQEIRGGIIFRSKTFKKVS